MFVKLVFNNCLNNNNLSFLFFFDDLFCYYKRLSFIFSINYFLLILFSMYSFISNKIHPFFWLIKFLTKFTWSSLIWSFKFDNIFYIWALLFSEEAVLFISYLFFSFLFLSIFWFFCTTKFFYSSFFSFSFKIGLL